MRNAWRDIFLYEDYVKFQEKLRKDRREFLLFCQHPPTITAGIKSRPENLLFPATELSRLGIGLFPIRRGGDFTAHEPGQLCIYPHVDLRRRNLPLGLYFQRLLEITQEALQLVYRITVHPEQKAPGLYTEDGAKLVSIGIDASKFFTSHGVAVNLTNDGQTFMAIHPCGRAGQKIATVQDCGGKPHQEFLFRKTWQDQLALFLSRFHHDAGIH
ncbi:MAG: lipoyl(octanoyl) transferase LipB [Spirochaetales bacterium]|nr:lipoyl(octanoyl) transferase LipB [Spirochaetales bacterium]